MTIAELKAELLADPAALGYAEMLAKGQDGSIADALNRVNPAVKVNRGVIPSYEVAREITVEEWSKLTDAHRGWLTVILSAGYVDTSHRDVRAGLDAVFEAIGVKEAVTALQTRQGSRAEQLWGAGATVDHMHVAEARR